MNSDFDDLRENYETIIDREFKSSADEQRFMENITTAKDIADALHNYRQVHTDFSITSADTEFVDEDTEPMPQTTDECRAIYDPLMLATDTDHSTYDALNVKSNTIKALIYIHWHFEHIRYLDTEHTVPTKLKMVQKIIHKLVNCASHWGVKIKTTPVNFVQMSMDLQDNKSIFEILNNFNLDDLKIYGY